MKTDELVQMAKDAIEHHNRSYSEAFMAVVFPALAQAVIDLAAIVQPLCDQRQIRPDQLVEYLNRECAYNNDLIGELAMDLANMKDMDWVNVVERLPDDSGLFIVFSPDIPDRAGNVWACTFTVDRNGEKNWNTEYIVTHWRAMPVPPEVK